MVSLFLYLSANPAVVWYPHQSVLHGDLNASNVAVEVHSGTPRGYIFDASGSGGGPSVRDFAALEVTVLLHRRPSVVFNTELLCCALYGSNVELLDASPNSDLPEMARRVFALIAEIRRNALRCADAVTYALCVLDVALMQLGGLDFTVSRNKIGRPRDAAVLCARISKWFRRNAKGSPFVAPIP